MPTPMTRARISILYIAAIFILLALVSVSSYLASINIDKQSNAIVHESIPFSDAAANLLTDLINQETGMRGYLLSGDEKFLEAFTNGKAQLEKDLAAIQVFEQRYPSTHMIIESEVLPQIQLIQAHYTEQLNLISNGGMEEARKRVYTGKINMDHFRTINKKFQDNVAAITTAAYEASHKAGTNSRMITLIGSLLAMVVAALSAVLFYRANQAEEALRKREESYRYMAESLEAQNEEILAQQEEQERTLLQLSEREHELETISSYQETLTAQVDLRDFLHHSVPALLDSLLLDAALIATETADSSGQYEIIYSTGFPESQARRVVDELSGPEKRVIDEKTPLTRKRPLTGKESGLHQGLSEALDQYFPLLSDQGRVVGLLILTSYNSNGGHESRQRLTRGLLRQFSLAFHAQLMNEERRRQSVHLELLNDELQTEKRLIEEQRDLIESIVESTRNGMLLCDAAGNVQFANQRVQQYFSTDIRGRSVIECCLEREVLSPPLSAVRQVADTLLSGDLRQFIERFTIHAGSQNERHIELFATPVKEVGNSDKYGFLMVFRDRTEEERIDDMKNEFVSIVSHELRTPLASVLGFIEILLHRELSADKQKKYMETIYREATRLSTLINDFLDLQRMESGKQVFHFAPLEAVSVAEEIVEQWQGKQKHHLHFESSETELWLKADDDRIRQVLHNLISNAIKYSPGADRVDIRLYRRGESAVFEIQDYGLGIPAESKENMFSKFFRVDNSDRRQIGGTGLGLAIVKEIVEAHQGVISFDSAMGEGTIFRVEIGLYELPSLENSIVILEDDDNLAQIMQVALSSLNVPTVQLRSAEEGMLLLDRSRQNSPLLFIVDIHLEGVKSGWDFISYVYSSSIYNHLPIVVTTALDLPANYTEKDAHSFLKKPFTMERLLQVVTLLMQNRDRTQYAFPAQDEAALSSTLKRNGIQVKDIQKQEETIIIDIKPQQ